MTIERTKANKARRMATAARRYDAKKAKIRRWAAKHGVLSVPHLATCGEIRTIIKEHRLNPF